MIRFSVLYPNSPGSTFEWNYYLGEHAALARRLLVPRGMLRIEIDRGVAGFPPGAPPPFHAVGHLFFASLDDLTRALAASAADLIADQQKYFSGQSVVQINEMVEI